MPEPLIVLDDFDIVYATVAPNPAESRDLKESLYSAIGYCGYFRVMWFIGEEEFGGRWEGEAALLHLETTREDYDREDLSGWIPQSDLEVLRILTRAEKTELFAKKQMIRGNA